MKDCEFKNNLDSNYTNIFSYILNLDSFDYQRTEINNVTFFNNYNY